MKIHISYYIIFLINDIFGWQGGQGGRQSPLLFKDQAPKSNEGGRGCRGVPPALEESFGGESLRQRGLEQKKTHCEMRDQGNRFVNPISPLLI